MDRKSYFQKLRKTKLKRFNTVEAQEIMGVKREWAKKLLRYFWESMWLNKISRRGRILGGNIWIMIDSPEEFNG